MRTASHGASDEIAYDDLKVVAIDEHGIHCTGFDGGDLPSRFVVDPADGTSTRDDG